MKRLFAGILVFVICISLAVIAGAEEFYVNDNSVGLIINEEWTSPDQPPVLENDRTLAPLRAVAEKLDFEMGWDEATKKVTAEKDGTLIVMHIGQKEMTKNGEVIYSDVAPIIVNSRTMIPVRIVAELLGCNVEWNGDSYTVFVNSPKTYEYYNSLTYTKRVYNADEIIISGYLGEVVSLPNDITSTKSEIPYLVLDMKSDFVIDDLTCRGVKRVELDLSGLDINIDSLLGKRVTITGETAGVEMNVYHSYPFIFRAKKIEEADNSASDSNTQSLSDLNYMSKLYGAELDKMGYISSVSGDTAGSIQQEFNIDELWYYVADINKDDILDLAVATEQYEGNGVIIYTYKNSRMTEVFTTGMPYSGGGTYATIAERDGRFGLLVHRKNSTDQFTYSNFDSDWNIIENSQGFHNDEYNDWMINGENVGQESWYQRFDAIKPVEFYNILELRGF